MRYSSTLTVFLMVLGLVASLPEPVKAENTIPAFMGVRFCNQTNEDVSLAIARFSARNDSFNTWHQDWISQGWWVIKPRRCEVVLADNFKGKQLYFHAEGRNGGLWEGDTKFCTRNTSFTFLNPASGSGSPRDLCSQLKRGTAVASRFRSFVPNRSFYTHTLTR